MSPVRKIGSSARRRAAMFGSALGVVCAAAVSGCDRPAEGGLDPGAAPAPTSDRRRPEPPPSSRLLRSKGSPYGLKLQIEGNDVYLLSTKGVRRLGLARQAESWSLELGTSPRLTAGAVWYWADGALQRVPVSGGEAKVMTKLAEPPLELVGAGESAVWLERLPEGRFSIRTLTSAGVRTVLEAKGYPSALAVQDDTIYFAERAVDRTWRLGRVSWSGGAPVYTPSKRGRTPSEFVTRGDLFYYDGPTRSVRRVSPDLRRENVLAENLICSPIAVARHVYCAQPAGLLEIDLQGGVRRTSSAEHSGVITALGASPALVAWLTDTGNGEFAVDAIVPSESEPRAAPRE